MRQKEVCVLPRPIKVLSDPPASGAWLYEAPAGYQAHPRPYLLFHSDCTTPSDEICVHISPVSGCPSARVPLPVPSVFEPRGLCLLPQDRVETGAV